MSDQEQITMSRDALLCVLWSLCLSDHMGDVWDSIGPLTKLLDLPQYLGGGELLDEMKLRDLIPEYQRED